MMWLKNCRNDQVGSINFSCHQVKNQTSVSNNVYQNLFGELKTPDKYAFDYNSVVSENKHGASTTN